MVRTSPTFRYRSLNNVDTSGTAAAVSYWCESQPHSPRPCGARCTSCAVSGTYDNDVCCGH
jgi:hypothetical protein